MQIVPITSPVEFADFQNLEAFTGDATNFKKLANFATTHGQPCLLSFLPGINCEKVAYQDITVAEYLLHHNAKMLVYAPCSPELYDAKGAYMEAFSVKGGPAIFFGATTLTSVSMRLVMEIITLFDLTADELRTLCTIPCRILPSDHFRALSLELLKSLPSNNDIARKLEEVHQRTKVSLPMRLVKAKKLMFIDVLHAFRAMGVDPYAAIVAIAKKDDLWFKNCQIGDKDTRAFDIKPVPTFLMDLEYPEGRTMDIPVVRVIEKNSELNMETAALVSVAEHSVNDITAPITVDAEVLQNDAESESISNSSTDAAKEKFMADIAATLSDSGSAADPQFKVGLQARMCVPCEADAWDNDNPNRNEPGYRWETCSEEVCKNIANKLASMELSVMSMAQIKSFIEAELKYPCRAKVSVDGCGFKLTLQF